MNQTLFIGITFIVIVLEIVIGTLVFSRRNRKKKEEFDNKESKKNGLLCRFVLDGTGTKIGESVAVAEDMIIIKSGVKYLGVPIKHVEEEEKTLLVKGLFDFSKAEEIGEKWRAESLHEINQTDAVEGKKDGI